MKDERYIQTVTIDLYWAGFRAGEQLAGKQFTDAALAERKEVISKAQTKLIKRFVSKP